jgi:acyl-CoA reductase-like NAD-dependent aldehyde dehydrogenase
MLKYFEARYRRRLKPRRFRCLRPGFWTKANTILFEPLGTIGLVGPANFPFSLPVMTAAACLLCGNRVVFKPSEKCPATARLIGLLVRESGFPEPVFEIAEGGEETVREIIGRPSVRKIIFFGGYEAGRRVAALCGRHFKTCVLELGASGSALVRADADLRRAARGLAWSAFYAGGRSCLGTKAAYVHARVKDRLTRLLVEETSRLRCGEFWDPGTDVCARREEEMPPEVRRFLDETKGKGATVWTSAGLRLVILEGSRSGEPALPEGEMPWPFLVVCPVDSDDEALGAMNRSAYGLGASVWSRDRRRAREIAGKLQARLVWVNDTSVGMPQAPWGGTERSGWGRLFSELALSELTSTKIISAEGGRLVRRKFWWFPYSRKKYRLLVAVNALVFGSRRLKAVLSLFKSGIACCYRRGA